MIVKDAKLRDISAGDTVRSLGKTTNADAWTASARGASGVVTHVAPHFVRFRTEAGRMLTRRPSRVVVWRQA